MVRFPGGPPIWPDGRHRRCLPHQHIDADLAALLHCQEIGQQTAGHLDHLHDAGGDLGDADAVGLAAGEEVLDALGGCCSCGGCLR